MKTSVIFRGLVASAMVMTLTVLQARSTFASENAPGQCADLLQIIPDLGYSNCTWELLSLVHVMQTRSQEQSEVEPNSKLSPVQDAICSEFLETVSGLSNISCTAGNLSAILVFQQKDN